MQYPAFVGAKGTSESGMGAPSCAVEQAGLRLERCFVGGARVATVGAIGEGGARPFGLVAGPGAPRAGAGTALSLGVSQTC